MFAWTFRRIGLPATLALIVGCRMSVPIHVWQPPVLESTVGKTVVIQSVDGPREATDPIKQKLLATVPRDVGRATSIVTSDTLRPKRGTFDSKVMLASATDEDNSDVAVASLARRQGVDFVLHGQVLTAPTPTPSDSGSSQPVGKRSPLPTDPRRIISDGQQQAESLDDPRLTLSWRLTAVGEEPSNQGRPISVDLKSAVDRYPELAYVDDAQEVLYSAAARETYRLITPSVDRTRVQLAIPYGLPGSRKVRRGNIAAINGNWAEAERIWGEAWHRHRWQAAAIHNLAIAAAAGQEFSRAKQLARQAIRLQSLPLHKQTLVWIELRQRDYHRAFGLPDPPEGWFVTQP